MDICRQSKESEIWGKIVSLETGVVFAVAHTPRGLDRPARATTLPYLPGCLPETLTK